MDQHFQYDRKRKLKQKIVEEDDEQVEKTLNFFDSIIDPYLLDQETQDQQRTKSDRKITPPIKTNGHSIQQVKQEFDVNSRFFNLLLGYSFDFFREIFQQIHLLHHHHLHKKFFIVLWIFMHHIFINFKIFVVVSNK